MTLPNLPTDSIYKFSFMAGFTSIIFAGYLTFQRADESKLASSKSTQELYEMTVAFEHDKLSQDSIDFELKMDSLYKKVDPLIKMRKLFAQSLHYKRQSAVLRADKERSSLNHKTKDVFNAATNRLIWSFFGLGVLLMVTAGIPWLKIQYIQDDILLMQRQQLMSALALTPTKHLKKSEPNLFHKRKGAK
jgi:hypothetical protein